MERGSRVWGATQEKAWKDLFGHWTWAMEADTQSQLEAGADISVVNKRRSVGFKNLWGEEESLLYIQQRRGEPVEGFKERMMCSKQVSWLSPPTWHTASGINTAKSVSVIHREKLSQSQSPWDPKKTRLVLHCHRPSDYKKIFKKKTFSRERDHLGTYTPKVKHSPLPSVLLRVGKTDRGNP